MQNSATVHSIRIPYSRQWIDEEDISAVSDVLRSPWLTTGPKVREFEQRFAEFTGAREAVAVNSGTAALHAAMYALKIGPDDEVIVPAMTFAASANCVVYQGGTPIFADVDPETLLIDPVSVTEKISVRTKAIVAVDYTGQPCDYDRLRELVERKGISLVADAAHSLGGSYKGGSVGVLADLNTFSFHPVKLVTTGEGGMVTTDCPKKAEAVRRFRNHNMNNDSRQREENQQWFYRIEDLGYNYRLSDIQCALGISQLKKAHLWVARKETLARCYEELLAGTAIVPLRTLPQLGHARHLFVVRLPEDVSRENVFRKMRDQGIGVNVHYLPVHLHPFYRSRFGTRPGQCPIAEAASLRILSLPLYPKMTEGDVEEVVTLLKKAVADSGH